MPLDAARRAVAAPIPRLAPVMRATPVMCRLLHPATCLPRSADLDDSEQTVRDRFEGWTIPRSPSGCSMDVHRRAPVVSPDGTQIAFVVASIDLKKNVTNTRVWLDAAPITAGPHDGNPEWSPDGRFLAFTSRRGEKKGDSTLHILPVGGPGETRTLCTMPDGLGDVEWSPDGRWIAFTSRTRHERYEAEDVSWQAPRKMERVFLAAQRRGLDLRPPAARLCRRRRRHRAHRAT